VICADNRHAPQAEDVLLWFESRELAPASACNGKDGATRSHGEQIVGSVSLAIVAHDISRLDEKIRQVMPDYRLYSITQDNHIASRPVTIVCDDDTTAVQQSQKLVDRNDIQLWQGRRLVTRLKAKLVA
jgi:hypothetical protein